MKNQRIGCALLIVLTQALACGNSSDGGPGGSSGGSSAGMAAIAGMSAGGSSGGTANVAGTSAGGSGGTTNVGGSAGSSSGALPSGAVTTCNGPGCPYGQCNNSSTTTCTSVYPGEVGPAVPLCKADGDYCLGLGSPSDFHTWAVHCVGTTPTAKSCASLCAYSFIDKTAQCSGT